MPQSFVDKQTGQPFYAPDEGAVQAALADPARYEPLGPVSVTTPSGSQVNVDADSARTILGIGGAPTSGLAQDEAGRQAAEAKRFDNPVAAGALGLGRSLTFGATDALARAVGADYEVDKLKEHNKGASLGGEIAGALLPVGAPGIIARAAKSAGNAVRAESVASKLVGAAVEGAVDGGAWNAAQKVSEASLGHDELTPESLIASIGMGAFFGGAVGGGLAATGMLSGSIRKKAAGEANPLLHTRSKGAKELGQHYGEALRELDSGVDDAFRAARDQRRAEILQVEAARDAGKVAPNPLVDENYVTRLDAKPPNPAEAQDVIGTMAGKKKRPPAAEPVTPTGIPGAPEAPLAPTGISNPRPGTPGAAALEQAKGRIPRYQDLAEDELRVVNMRGADLPPAHELDMLPDGFDPGVRLDSVREGIAAGNLRDPIKLTVHPDGRIGVIDGRHRMEALRRHFPDLEYPVRFERGVDLGPRVESELAQAAPAAEEAAATAAVRGGKGRDTLVDALPEGKAQGALERDAHTLVDELPYGAEQGAINKAAAADAKAAAAAAKAKPGVKPNPFARKDGEDAAVYARRVADEEQSVPRQAYAAVRKAMVKEFGKDMAVDFTKLAKLPPEEAFKKMQVVDAYANVVGNIRGMDVGEALGAKIQRGSPEVQSAFKGLSSLDRQGVADALQVPAEKLPQLGGAGEQLLKAYGVMRFSEGALAKAAANAGEAKVGEAVKGLAAEGLFGKAKSAVIGAALHSLGSPAITLMRLATKVGVIKNAIAKGVDTFVQASTGPRARRALIRAGTDIFNQVKFSEKEDKNDGLSPPMRRIKELQALAGNPARLESFVDDQLTAVRAHNLDLGFASAEVMKRRIMSVASRMPAVPPPDPFTGWQPEPSKAELSQWARYLEAAEKGPAFLLDELIQGDVAPETVEAVKEIYPGLFEAVRAKLIEKVIDRGTPLSYQDRLNMGQLFDAPVEPTQAPETVHALQSMYAMQEQPPEAPRPRGTPKPPSMTKGQQFAV